MSKIFKKIAAIAMAAAMAMSMAVSASAACTHYNQRISCGAYIGENRTDHTFNTMVNGVSVTQYCTQRITIKFHTVICLVSGCGYSKTDSGSGCYMYHSACGAASRSLHS